MSDLERYLEAASRPNTRRSYAASVRHFEVEWGGHLPATADTVARYLVDYAGKLSINTLKQRLAGLARWHADFGFHDPTRSTLVRTALKGIQAVHGTQEKQAQPLQLDELTRVWDAVQVQLDRSHGAAQLAPLRDRALVTLGFWRGFRGDELTRLQVQHVTIVPGKGMSLFLPRTKGDRQNEGTTFKVPALSRLCPVVATSEWMRAAELTSGPLFRAVDRWGHVRDDELHPNSIVPLLRRMFAQAGLSTPEVYSGHSLRRGFASWADAHGWSVKALMEYVGWKDLRSAMRYLDGTDAFGQQRIETSLRLPAPATPQPEPPALSAPDTP